MKRLLDILLVFLVAPIGIPLGVVVAMIVWIGIGRPIFFRQIRPGCQGKPFELIKFRTMSQKTDSSGNLLPDAQRLGKLGKFLRATSLDELPELWNILKGQMSFVGPRPLLMEYLDHYTPDQQRRHSVRPGLTGWAQVNGRNNLTWEMKLKMDTWYVDHQSLKLDLWILLLTAYKVLRQKDVKEEKKFTDCQPPNNH